MYIILPVVSQCASLSPGVLCVATTGINEISCMAKGKENKTESGEGQECCSITRYCLHLLVIASTDSPVSLS